MTNDNIHVTNAQVAEAAALPVLTHFENIPIEDLLDDVEFEAFDAEGNVIPFDLEDTFSQADEDVKLDVSNASH